MIQREWATGESSASYLCDFFQTTFATIIIQRGQLPVGRHSFVSIAQALHRLAVSGIHPSQGATHFTCSHQNSRNISQELENLPVDSSSGGGGGGGPSILDADKNALQVHFLISILPCVPYRIYCINSSIAVIVIFILRESTRWRAK